MCRDACPAAIVPREMGTPTSERKPPNDPWAVFGYLMSGPLFYGAVGWALDRWLHTSFLFPVGLLFGIALAMYFVLRLYWNN